MAKNIAVTLLPSGEITEVSAGKSLMAELKENGIHINSACGGCASCTKCIIKVVANENNMNEMSFEEKQLLGNTFHITRERLACQVQLLGPITIDIADHIADAPIKVNKPLRRSREEARQVVDERREKMKEKPKKVGGGKKPGPFKFNNEDIKE
jgi:ferredoxin